MGVPARAVNRLIAVWVGRLGLPAPGVWMLVAPGRRTGRLHSTPVCVAEAGRSAYLVSPRGETQWARNVRAAGRCDLVRGRRLRPVRATELAGPEREAALEVYLDRFGLYTRRLFGLPRGFRAEDVRRIAHRHPVFRIEG